VRLSCIATQEQEVEKIDAATYREISARSRPQRETKRKNSARRVAISDFYTPNPPHPIPTSTVFTPSDLPERTKKWGESIASQPALSNAAMRDLKEPFVIGDEA
jgi:hypothetical protein